MTGRTEIEYHVYCDDECVAICFCDDEERSEQEVWHYARVYENDGDIKVYRVTKTFEPIG